MKKSSTSSLTPAQLEALQARFALRVTARLEESTRALPHDITERLRVAREQAVRGARLVKAQAVVSPASSTVVVGQLAAVGGGGGDSRAFTGWKGAFSARPRRPLDDGPLPWGWRLASVLPALALVAGLWGVQYWSRSEQVEAAADVDIALLTDELPPSAYTDPGFEEYLRSADESVAPPVGEQAAPESVPGQPDSADDTGGMTRTEVTS